MNSVNEAIITVNIDLEQERIIIKVDGATFKVIPFEDYEDFRKQILKPQSTVRQRHQTTCIKIEQALNKIKLTPEDIDNYEDKKLQKMGKFKDLLDL